MMNRRDDLHNRDPTSPELPRLNKDIQNRFCVHKRKKWRDFVETMDQKTDLNKLWRTIRGIDGRAKREAENEALKKLQWNLVLIVKDGQTYFFKRDPSSDE